MSLRPEPFNGSTQLVTPANAGVDTEIAGVAFKGFTSVAIYDGGDNTGTLVAYLAGQGTLPFNEHITCSHGVFVECVGSGEGSVWM